MNECAVERRTWILIHMPCGSLIRREEFRGLMSSVVTSDSSVTRLQIRTRVAMNKSLPISTAAATACDNARTAWTKVDMHDLICIIPICLETLSGLQQTRTGNNNVGEPLLDRPANRIEKRISYCLYTFRTQGFVLSELRKKRAK
jgi:hypothetical protein